MNASQSKSCSKTAMLPDVKSTSSAEPNANVKKKMGGITVIRALIARIHRRIVIANAIALAVIQTSFAAAGFRFASGANTAAVSGV